MSAVQFIKTKLNLIKFFSCAFLTQLLLIILSPIPFIADINIKAYFCTAVFLLMFWVLNIILIVKTLMLDKENKRNLIWYIVGLFTCLAFPFISYFIWSGIVKRLKCCEQMNMITFDEPKNVFIRVNTIFCILMVYAWVAFMAYFSTVHASVVLQSKVFNAISLTIIPVGISAIAMLIYISTKFKNVTKNCNVNSKMHIYYELLWITFFFAPMAIWLLIYVNKKIDYCTTSKMIIKGVEIKNSNVGE